jgi:hypothetical protein
MRNPFILVDILTYFKDTILYSYWGRGVIFNLFIYDFGGCGPSIITGT